MGRGELGREVELGLDPSGEGRALLDAHLGAAHLALDGGGGADGDRALRLDVAGERAADHHGARADVAGDRSALLDGERAGDADVALDVPLDAEVTLAPDAPAHPRAAPQDRLARFGGAAPRCRTSSHSPRSPAPVRANPGAKRGGPYSKEVRRATAAGFAGFDGRGTPGRPPRGGSCPRSPR